MFAEPHSAGCAGAFAVRFSIDSNVTCPMSGVAASTMGKKNSAIPGWSDSGSSGELVHSGHAVSSW